MPDDAWDLSVDVIRSSRRRRTIAISVQSGAVSVRAPMRTTDAQVRELVGLRGPWVVGRLQLSSSAGLSPLCDGSTLPFLGNEVFLEVRATSGRPRRPNLECDRLAVEVRARETPEEFDAAVSGAVVSWYRTEAEVALGTLAQSLIERTGLTPKTVLVRTQRSRWGSCGPDGTIRLSWRLAMVDPALAEYVVIHELVHLKHKHHQPSFWNAVGELLPDFRERRRRLQEAGRKLPAL
ncbi:MAG: SprT family zinc-dependent metalloprotease [bacterium]